jgi:hypothetical protein
MTVPEYLIAVIALLVRLGLTNLAQRFNDLMRTGAVRPMSRLVTRPDGSC